MDIRALCTRVLYLRLCLCLVLLRFSAKMLPASTNGQHGNITASTSITTNLTITILLDHAVHLFYIPSPFPLQLDLVTPRTRVFLLAVFSSATPCVLQALNLLIPMESSLENLEDMYTHWRDQLEGEDETKVCTYHILPSPLVAHSMFIFRRQHLCLC